MVERCKVRILAVLEFSSVLSFCVDAAIVRNIQILSSLVVLDSSSLVSSSTGIASLFQQTCQLCQSSSRVQSSCISNRLDDTSREYSCLYLLITLRGIIRHYTESSPLVVMHLVIYHTVITGHLHEEVSFPLQFIQNVRCAIAGFRNVNEVCAFLELFRVTLVSISQCPHGNTAVYNILTIVTSIIPTAGNVLCTVAGISALDFSVCLFCVKEYPLISDISFIRLMTSLTSQSGLAVILTSILNVLFFNIDTRTVQIVVVQRVAEQVAVNIIANSELHGLATSSQCIFTRGCNLREINNLCIFPSTFIIDGCTCSTRQILRASYFPRNRSCAFFNKDSSSLFQSGEITQLVDCQTSFFCFRLSLIYIAIVTHINQSEVIELNNCTSREADKVSILTITTEMECPLNSLLAFRM